MEKIDKPENAENRGFQRDAETGVELKEKLSPSAEDDDEKRKRTNGLAMDAIVQPSTSCKPEVCQAARMRFSAPELSGTGPWHRRKTIFLVGFLVALAVWIVVYVTLSQLKLL